MNELAMLKRQNTLRADCLAPGYRKEWKSLLGYLEFGKLSAFEEQLIAKELISMTFMAQRDGVTLGDYLGMPICEFAKQIVREQISTAPNKIHLLECIKTWLMILSVVWLILFIGLGFPIQSVAVTLSMILASISAPIVAIFSDLVCTPYIIRLRDTIPNIPLIGNMGVFFGAIVLLQIFRPITSAIMIPCNLLAITLILSLLAVIFNALYRFQLHRISANYNWMD